MNPISEDDIEKAAIKELAAQHGYIHLDCMTEQPEVLPDNSGRTAKTSVVLPEILRESLRKINPQIPAHIIAEEAENLIKQRDLLLPRLMSGKIDIQNEAEA